MTRLLRCIIFLVLLANWNDVFAQVTFDGCIDFRGRPVASVSNPGIQDVALATYAPDGTPLIVYNPSVLGWLASPTRLFFYAHECAHHVLGHGVRGHPSSREQEADCWGIRELVNNGSVGNREFAQIQQDIARFGQGDWTHLPGPQRAMNLPACLEAVREDHSNIDNRADPSPDTDDDALWEACYDRCSSTEDRCTNRCDDSQNWDACYDRCQTRFDSCTNRC